MSAVSAAMMRAVARKAALTNYVRYYINNAPIVVAASSSSLAKKKGIRSTSSAASDRHARSHSVHLAASMPQPAVAVAYDYYPDFDDVDCNDDDEEDGLRGHASSRASFCSVGVRGANSSSHVGISTNSYDDDYSHRNRPSLPRAFGGLTPPPPPISPPRPIIGSTTRSGGSGGGGGGGGRLGHRSSSLSQVRQCGGVQPRGVRGEHVLLRGVQRLVPGISPEGGGGIDRRREASAATAATTPAFAVAVAVAVAAFRRSEQGRSADIDAAREFPSLDAQVSLGVCILS